MTDSVTSYEKLICENEAKGYQIKLVVNDFRDVEYIHLRKYFLSFEDGYVPSREGVSIPTSIVSINNLLDGLLDIMSKAEGADEVLRHLGSKISDLTAEVK